MKISFLTIPLAALLAVSCGSKKDSSKDKDSKTSTAESIQSAADIQGVDLSRYYISETAPWSYTTEQDWVNVTINSFDPTSLKLTGKVENASSFSFYSVPNVGTVDFDLVEATQAYDMYAAINKEAYTKNVKSGQRTFKRTVRPYNYGVKLYKDSNGLYNNRCDIAIQFESASSQPFSSEVKTIEDAANGKECIFIN